MRYQDAIGAIGKSDSRGYPYRENVEATRETVAMGVTGGRKLLAGITRGMAPSKMHRGGIAIISGVRLSGDEKESSQSKLVTVAAVVGIVSGIVWLAFAATRPRQEWSAFGGGDTGDIAEALRAKGRDPYQYNL